MFAIMSLANELGPPLSVDELAGLLHLSPNTVRKYADRWGGCEVAPGVVRFWENIVRRKIYHGDEGQTEQGPTLARRGDGERKKQVEELPNQTGSRSLGGCDPRGNEGPGEGGDENRHGLCDLD